MAKGLFTQCVCVLLSRPVRLDDLVPLLSDFTIVKRLDTGSAPIGGPTLPVALPPEVNGYVAIDLQSEPWPDRADDPADAPAQFAAWTMGSYGPFAFPGCLARAAEQSWTWREARTLPAQHRAFARVRASYAFGTRKDD